MNLQKTVIMCYLVFVTLEHKTSRGTFWEIEMHIHFYFMPKIIMILRSCSMNIFSTVNISKLNFWLVICIAKNLIWTTLKMIFSIFRFFCTLRFQIYKYCPIITNHTLMEKYLFSFNMMHKSKFWKIDPYDWFCSPGSHLTFKSKSSNRNLYVREQNWN